MPDPFHKPPPSAAVLFATVQSVKVEFPGPLIWNAPPFPGLAVVILFPLKVTLLNEYVSPVAELISIPPPALLAVFPEIVIPSTLSVPGVRLKIPPPEPEVPSAI